MFTSEGRGEVDLRTTRNTRNAAAYATPFFSAGSILRDIRGKITSKQ